MRRTTGDPRVLRRGAVKVAFVDDIRAGRAAAPYCDAELPRLCPMCQKKAVLPLNVETRLQQPDKTTHVCHPVLDGCNQGFTVYGDL